MSSLPVLFSCSLPLLLRQAFTQADVYSGRSLLGAVIDDDAVPVTQYIMLRWTKGIREGCIDSKSLGSSLAALFEMMYEACILFPHASFIV
jgi:hypothetical protein